MPALWTAQHIFNLLSLIEGVDGSADLKKLERHLDTLDVNQKQLLYGRKETSSIINKWHKLASCYVFCSFIVIAINIRD